MLKVETSTSDIAKILSAITEHGEGRKICGVKGVESFGGNSSGLQRRSQDFLWGGKAIFPSFLQGHVSIMGKINIESYGTTRSFGGGAWYLVKVSVKISGIFYITIFAVLTASCGFCAAVS